MKYRLTNKDLKKSFDSMNELFFNNEVDSNIKVRFASDEDCQDSDGIHFHDGQIFIHEDFKRHSDMAALTLLHEMAHAHLHALGYIGWPHDGGHGTQFHVELDRLYKAGAYDGMF